MFYSQLILKWRFHVWHVWRWTDQRVKSLIDQIWRIHFWFQSSSQMWWLLHPISLLWIILIFFILIKMLSFKIFIFFLFFSFWNPYEIWMFIQNQLLFINRRILDHQIGLFLFRWWFSCIGLIFFIMLRFWIDINIHDSILYFFCFQWFLPCLFDCIALNIVSEGQTHGLRTVLIVLFKIRQVHLSNGNLCCIITVSIAFV